MPTLDFGNMAGVNMPRWAIDRSMSRRGSAHPFANISAQRTALVVIDLQVGYMHARGNYMDYAGARDIVPQVNRMAQGMRSCGGLVVWVQNTHDESCMETWKVQQTMNSAASSGQRNAALTVGAPGHELWPDLDVGQDDLRVLKRRYSAFMPGTCDLAPMLKERGINTVFIAGALTNVCCDTSARDAMMLDFRTTMLSDGCASTTEEEHDAALAAFYARFGDVMDVDFALSMLLARQGVAA